ncbi:MAG: YceI family protein [Myxococcaceae bacterium]
MRSLPSLFAAVLLAAPALAGAATWELDSSHSSASFAVRHLMVSTVRGDFGKTTGTLELDEKDVSKSKVEAAIEVTTINTRDAKRDEHLRSAEFFDVAKYPTITFKSKKVEKAGKGQLKVTGALTIRGVTKDVVLDVEYAGTEAKDPWGNIKQGATATTRINRSDFGLTWNKALETGGVAVGDEVKITLDVEMAKKQPAAKKI